MSQIVLELDNLAQVIERYKRLQEILERNKVAISSALKSHEDDWCGLAKESFMERYLNFMEQKYNRLCDILQGLIPALEEIKQQAAGAVIMADGLPRTFELHDFSYAPTNAMERGRLLMDEEQTDRAIRESNNISDTIKTNAQYKINEALEWLRKVEDKAPFNKANDLNAIMEDLMKGADNYSSSLWEYTRKVQSLDEEWKEQIKPYSIFTDDFSNEAGGMSIFSPLIVPDEDGGTTVNTNRLRYLLAMGNAMSQEELDEFRQLLDDPEAYQDATYEEILNALLTQYGKMTVNTGSKAYDNMNAKLVYLYLFEARHPEYLDSFRAYKDFLAPLLTIEGMTNNDIINIRFITYSAPWDCFKLIMALARTDCKLMVGKNSTSLNDSAMNFARNIHFTADEVRSLFKNGQGAYNTLFHEMGHAIDNRFGSTKGSHLAGMVPNFNTTGDWKALQQAMERQIRQDIEKYMNSTDFINQFPNLTNDQRELIMKYIFQGAAGKYVLASEPQAPITIPSPINPPILSITDSGQKWPVVIGGETEEAFKNIMFYFRDGKLTGANNSTLSDAWSAVTNCRIQGPKYYHPAGWTSAEKNLFISIDYYWYYGATPTDRQGAEFFASDFAAMTTRNSAILSADSRNFPEATQMVRNYLHSLASGVGR